MIPADALLHLAESSSDETTSVSISLNFWTSARAHTNWLSAMEHTILDSFLPEKDRTSYKKKCQYYFQHIDRQT